jgi:hypothetical protein
MALAAPLAEHIVNAASRDAIKYERGRGTMSIKQRIWLLPAIAILTSILSLSANYWFSASAGRVLAEADSVQ